MIIHDELNKYLPNFKSTVTAFRPSQSNIWLNCLGYLTLHDNEDTEEAKQGRTNHQEAEELIHNALYKNKEIKHEDEHIQDYAKKVVKTIKHHKDDPYGIEVPVYSYLGQFLIHGTTDFFLFNQKENKLFVGDFKSGEKEYSFSQLKMYAFMLCETFNFKPDKIKYMIFSRLSSKSEEQDFKDLLEFKNLVQEKVNTKIKKFEPQHLKCSDCFKLVNCPAGRMEIKKTVEEVQENATETDYHEDFTKLISAHKAIKDIYKETTTRLKEHMRLKNFEELKKQNVGVSRIYDKEFWNTDNPVFGSFEAENGKTEIKLDTPKQLKAQGVKIPKELVKKTKVVVFSKGGFDDETINKIKYSQQDLEMKEALEKSFTDNIKQIKKEL